MNAKAERLVEEIERLRRWKEEQMAVLSAWDGLVSRLVVEMERPPLGEFQWDTVRRYIDEIKKKLATSRERHRDDVQRLEAEKKALATSGPAVIDGQDVWWWQGDGTDDPESLSCPVVMMPGVLRRLVGCTKPAPGPLETAEDPRVRNNDEPTTPDEIVGVWTRREKADSGEPVWFGHRNGRSLVVQAACPWIWRWEVRTAEHGIVLASGESEASEETTMDPAEWDYQNVGWAQRIAELVADAIGGGDPPKPWEKIARRKGGPLVEETTPECEQALRRRTLAPSNDFAEGFRCCWEDRTPAWHDNGAQMCEEQADREAALSELMHQLAEDDPDGHVDSVVLAERMWDRGKARGRE